MSTQTPPPLDYSAEPAGELWTPVAAASATKRSARDAGLGDTDALRLSAPAALEDSNSNPFQAAQEDFEADPPAAGGGGAAEQVPEPFRIRIERARSVASTASSSASSRRGLPFTLPSDASKAMSAAFETLVKGEMTVGGWAAEGYKGLVMSSKAGLAPTALPTLWTVDHRTQLWRRMAPEELRDALFILISKELDRVGAYVIRECSSAEGDNKKAWQACCRRIDTAVAAYASLRALDNVVKIVAQRLLNEEVVAALDTARHLVPFKNGVLDLRTREMSPHEAKNCLTYALPYPLFDADFAPDRRVGHDMREYVHNLFEDDAAERAFQVMCGYCFTGETTEKAWWQWFSASNGGKTTAMQIICGAMGEFASRGAVPADELREGHKFQDIWADTLSTLPRKRLITIEELPKDFPLTSLMNQATDGTSDQRLQLGRKGIKHAVGATNLAKYWVSSNHVIKIPAGATGMVRRNRGVGLRFRFVDADTYSAAKSPSRDRPCAPDLVARLLRPENWPVIAAWLIEGAAAYYAGDKLTCPLFDENTFSLRVRGDPALEWLADTYAPCWPSEDSRISLNELVNAYRSAGRGASAATAWSSITSLLSTLTDLLLLTSWTEHGTVVQGVEGLRPRRSYDRSWAVEWEAVKAQYAKVSRAERRIAPLD